ncbi:hypothetical protein [Xanthomonas medicagonis]
MKNILASDPGCRVGGRERYSGVANSFLTARGNVYLQYGFARQTGEYRDT